MSVRVVLQSDSEFSPSLFRLSDESGSLETSLVAEGSFSYGHLDPKDGKEDDVCLRGVYSFDSHLVISLLPPLAVFIADTGKAVYVWIGSGASPAENKNAMPYAHVRAQAHTHTHHTRTYALTHTRMHLTHRTTSWAQSIPLFL